MAAALTLEVATPNGLALRTEASQVQAPSVNGEFGVLPGHLPVLAALRSGVLQYEASGKAQYAAVGPGFVEAEPLKVLLLTDLFALPDDIDVDAVTKELNELRVKNEKFDGEYTSAEFRELIRDIEWAEARIDAYRRANAA